MNLNDNDIYQKYLIQLGDEASNFQKHISLHNFTTFRENTDVWDCNTCGTLLTFLLWPDRIQIIYTDSIYTSCNDIIMRDILL